MVSSRETDLFLTARHFLFFLLDTTNTLNISKGGRQLFFSKKIKRKCKPGKGLR